MHQFLVHNIWVGCNADTINTLAFLGYLIIKCNACPSTPCRPCIVAGRVPRHFGKAAGRTQIQKQPRVTFILFSQYLITSLRAFVPQQGVFRGLQDARTPLQCSLTSNFLNILLAPVLIFWLGWGVKGAAAAIIIAQVVLCPWCVAFNDLNFPCRFPRGA